MERSDELGSRPAAKRLAVLGWGNGRDAALAVFVNTDTRSRYHHLHHQYRRRAFASGSDIA